MGHINSAFADNLHRWQQSGQPQAWVDARCGQWEPVDWFTLLGNLRHSEFWPLDPGEARALLERLRRERANLHRLIQSDLLRNWVEAHHGSWNHADWLALLDSLRNAGFWPIAFDAVGERLEELRAEWQNLRRWEQSGWPLRWIEEHHGAWSHSDWLALLRALRESEFWPLDLAAVGDVLERLKGPCRNFCRWIDSGEARQWVEARRGQWGHDDWLALLDHLRRSGYGPVDAEIVGRFLEESKRQYLNLRRWERSGQARTWVDAHQGQWTHDDWLALLDSLRRSEFWPMDPAAVGEVLAELRQEWQNLRRWQQSGQPLQWVEARGGAWEHKDWLALWEDLRRSEFWPLNYAAAEKLLMQTTAQWRNLRRWEEASQPWLWVKAHGGQWNHTDWQALLDTLQQSQYWPLDPEAVGAVLERVRQQYANLRRWRASGQPWQWLEAHQGHWGPDDWHALLATLRQSEFWPLEPALVLVELEALQEEKRNLCRWQESGEPRRWVQGRAGQWGHEDWLALLANLQRSAYWPLDPVAVGRVLEEARAEGQRSGGWPGPAWSEAGRAEMGEAPSGAKRAA